MSDNGNYHEDADGRRTIRAPRRDADKGREPTLLPGMMGGRMVSFAALLERVESAFHEEFRGTDALAEAKTRTKKLQLLNETANYVLAVESVQMGQEERAELIRRAYSNIFSYGPLDDIFDDERVTTVSIDGADKVSVRYGHAELTPLGPLFEDEQHLRRTLVRLLTDAGAELRPDLPYIETGFTMDNGRPLSLNLVAPPVTVRYGVDIRVHPKTAPALDDLVANDFMTDKVAEVLKVLAKSPHGVMIVGDVESGKTTLLNALLQEVNTGSTITVERAGELRPSPGVKQTTTQWQVKDVEGVTFGARIGEALKDNPTCMVLDEVRSDEPTTIAPLLESDTAPRQIWAFRGSAESKRLLSAVGMLARRANVNRSEEMVHKVYQRLPFVVAVRLHRPKEQLQLRSIAEWQHAEGYDYPDFVTLVDWDGQQHVLTGKHPSHSLDLPSEFWG